MACTLFRIWININTLLCHFTHLLWTGLIFCCLAIPPASSAVLTLREDIQNDSFHRFSLYSLRLTGSFWTTSPLLLLDLTVTVQYCLGASTQKQKDTRESVWGWGGRRTFPNCHRHHPRESRWLPNSSCFSGPNISET